MTYWTPPSWSAPPSTVPPATVFGEITRAGNTIILTVMGEPYQQNHAIAELAKMTATGDYQKYHGHAMEIPLTWPSVVQLGCTFKQQWIPGGKLKEWTLAEVARRTIWHDYPLRYPLPPGLSLKAWQPESVRNIAHIGCLLDDEPRLGKAQRNDQPILTPTGWLPIGKISVGDLVIGSQGQPIRVTGVHPQGIRPLYEVTTSDNIKIIVDAEHLWATQTCNDRARNPQRWRVKTTATIAGELVKNQHRQFLPVLNASPQHIVSITRVADDFATCISVDSSDHLYATTGAVLTHNTVSTIVGLVERTYWPHYPAVLPIIVLCPKSVVTSWVLHFQQWAPHLKVTPWRGTPAARRMLVGRFDVYVSSYGTAINDAKHSVPIREAPLLRINPSTVVVDEYHWCNNPEAKRTKAMQRIARKAASKGGLVIPLSATPFLDDFTGTAPTLEVFEYGAYPSEERITDRYVISYQRDYGAEVTKLNPDTEPELRASFLGRQLRRTQRDVAPWLSEKTYSTRYVELPAQYAKMYMDMEDRMIAELDSGDEVTPMSTITKIIRLQQLAASSCSLHCTYTTDEITGLEIEHQHLTPILPSWKIEAMLEVLAELTRPAIAFGVSGPLIRLAGQAAEAAGARVGYVVGGQSDRVRDGYVAAFQAGKLDLLAVVCAAGGTGLTLNMAAHEIFLQRPYSLVDAIQAENRGVGERYPTLDIVDLYATLGGDNKPTIDQRIRDILHVKAAKLGEYLQDPRIVRDLFGGQRRPKRPVKETAA